MTRKSIIEAVKSVLRDGLKRQATKAPARLRDEIMEIGRRAAKLPRPSSRTPEEIIGYDETGKPE